MEEVGRQQQIGSMSLVERHVKEQTSRFQRYQHTRGGTVRCQPTSVNRDHSFPKSLLFTSAFFYTSGQITAAELMFIATTKTQGRPNPFKLILIAGDVHSITGPATMYPYPVCTSRGVSYQCNRCFGWVHAKCSKL